MTSTTKVQKEIYKDVLNYEGVYQVSNLGNVKSLERKVKHCMGGFRLVKKMVLKQAIGSGGYFLVSLFKEGKQKTVRVHQLVAEAFLNHVSDGYNLVINHINFIKTDNCVENLEITTQRQNTNQKHIKSSSKYVGVHLQKASKKWISHIAINGKQKYLGIFKDELEAHQAYESALKRLF